MVVYQRKRSCPVCGTGTIFSVGGSDSYGGRNVVEGKMPVEKAAALGGSVNGTEKEV